MLWMKVALALEGLTMSHQLFSKYDCILMSYVQICHVSNWESNLEYLSYQRTIY